MFAVFFVNYEHYIADIVLNSVSLHCSALL